MPNPNELRLAHLRLDLAAYRRLQYDHLSLSPETRTMALELEEFTQLGPHERDTHAILWLEDRIAELEAIDE